MSNKKKKSDDQLVPAPNTTMSTTQSTNQQKQCTNCKQYKHKSRFSSKQSQCIDCLNAARKIKRDNDKKATEEKLERENAEAARKEAELKTIPQNMAVTLYNKEYHLLSLESNKQKQKIIDDDDVDNAVKTFAEIRLKMLVVNKVLCFKVKYIDVDDIEIDAPNIKLINILYRLYTKRPSYVYIKKQDITPFIDMLCNYSAEMTKNNVDSISVPFASSKISIQMLLIANKFWSSVCRLMDYIEQLYNALYKHKNYMNKIKSVPDVVDFDISYNMDNAILCVNNNPLNFDAMMFLRDLYKEMSHNYELAEFHFDYTISYVLDIVELLSNFKESVEYKFLDQWEEVNHSRYNLDHPKLTSGRLVNEALNNYKKVGKYLINVEMPITSNASVATVEYDASPAPNNEHKSGDYRSNSSHDKEWHEIDSSLQHHIQKCNELGIDWRKDQSKMTESESDPNLDDLDHTDVSSEFTDNNNFDKSNDNKFVHTTDSSMNNISPNPVNKFGKTLDSLEIVSQNQYSKVEVTGFNADEYIGSDEILDPYNSDIEESE